MADNHRGKGDESSKMLYCSFCGKSQHEVRKLIAGPSVFICDECVELCNDIIREEVQETGESKESDRLPIPAEIKATLDEYVIGQEYAKKGALGGGVQPLQAPELQGQEGRRRAFQEQHPPHRPRPAAARPCSRKLWPACSTCRSPWPTPPPSRRRATSARMSRTSSRSSCRSATTTSTAPRSASSISTRSTRFRASPTTPPSPATFRAKACNRRCSSSSKAPSRRCRPKAGASIRSRNSCKWTPPTSCSSAAAPSPASTR